MKPKNVAAARDQQREVSKDFVTHMLDHRCPKTGEIDNFEFQLNKWALESVAVVLLDMRWVCLQNLK